MNKGLLSRGVEEVIVKEHLEQAIQSGKKLRVKLGIDPTAPDLHLGHTVPLRKLKQFQDAGHQAVLIIGDFTAMIGDPTERLATRKTISENTVKENMAKYLQQAGMVIDVEKTEIRYNSQWLGASLDKVLDLAKVVTIQQLLHRADFKKRLEEGSDITLLEAYYPLLQGYDSVVVRADVEIGGTDQKFNLLFGRRVQRHFNLPEQDIVSVPLLEGTDGVRKMSKSFGNYIALEEEPAAMFGKIMAIPDELIDKYYELLTDFDRKINDPKESKLELARIIVNMYHKNMAGDSVKKDFIKLFSKHEKPENIEELGIVNKELGIIDLLLKAGVKSKSEARRLVEQKGIKLNDIVKDNINETVNVKDNMILQIGRRKFFKLKTP